MRNHGGNLAKGGKAAVGLNLLLLLTGDGLCALAQHHFAHIHGQSHGQNQRHHGQAIQLPRGALQQALCCFKAQPQMQARTAQANRLFIECIGRGCDRSP